MLYQSSYAALQVIVRGGHDVIHPVTGTPMDRVKPLIADFGTHGSEYNAINPLSGEIERHGDIRGFFFDSDSAAEQRDWTQDEHDSVVAVLDKLCLEQPFIVAKVEEISVAALKPWPTYDETHWKTIPVLAAQLGLTQVALAYERENKNRETVTSALEAGLQPISELTVSPQGEPEMITLES